MRAKKAAAQRVTELERKLAEANELVKQGQETMHDHAGVVVELTRALTQAHAQIDRHMNAIRELVDAKRKDNAGAQAEIEYWMGEVTRLHNELIDIRREAARASS